MGKFFDDLKQGLEDVLDHEKGKVTLRSHSLELPKPPSKYSAQDVQKIRSKWHYSQSVFALILNVSVKTVQSWESGERTPSHAALRLLELIDKGVYHPKVSKKAA